MKETVIVAAKRTPIGSHLGSLAQVPATHLGATAIRAVVDASQINPSKIDAVIMGMVLQGGAGQAAARQAMIYAGLPTSIPATTVHKVCGSGMQAVIDGARMIATGEADIVVAGGMESMSRAPHYLFTGRTGQKLGDHKLVDGMILDGLWDPYSNQHMGMCGETCAAKFSISREDQDTFAIMSYQKAIAASEAGKFILEIAPVTIHQPKGDPIIVSIDEEPGKVMYDKIRTLKPAFDRSGTITAANASKINDGASATMLMSKDKADELGLTPLGRIVSWADFAQDPLWFTTAPEQAIRQAVKKAGLTLNDIDFFEINEAFAVVGLVNIQLLGIDPNKVNVHGGAVALGHPIGMSGNRIITTGLHILKDLGGKYLCCSICLGGGGALAMVIENFQETETK